MQRHLVFVAAVVLATSWNGAISFGQGAVSGPTTGAAVTSSSSTTAPVWDPAKWKPGTKMRITGGEAEVTIDKMGPPTWTYTATAGTCSTCGITAPTKVTRVEIISNFVPVPCGNQNPNKKDVTTSSTDWKPNLFGDTLDGPADGSTEMTFDITCDANSGPIYLRVFWTPSRGIDHALFGPLPGPVKP